MAREPEKKIGGQLRKTDDKPRRRGRPATRPPADEILRNLGRRLKAVREEQKLSVAQVAKKTNIAPQTIIRLEEAGRPIRFPVMYQIAESLGYKLDFRLTKVND